MSYELNESIWRPVVYLSGVWALGSKTLVHIPDDFRSTYAPLLARQELVSGAQPAGFGVSLDRGGTQCGKLNRLPRMAAVIGLTSVFPDVAVSRWARRDWVSAHTATMK